MRDLELIEVDTTVKKCSRCGVTKSKFEFHRDRLTKDGRSYSCKACRREYHQTRLVIAADKGVLVGASHGAECRYCGQKDDGYPSRAEATRCLSAMGWVRKPAVEDWTGSEWNPGPKFWLCPSCHVRWDVDRRAWQGFIRRVRNMPDYENLSYKSTTESSTSC